MDKKFIINRQGNDFVLYAGLLNEAHDQGLVGISTKLLQIPTEDNGRVAICEATVTLQRLETTTMFTGIGDADPGNVTKMMLTCLIRMAETRAKARALRDATNIGVTAFEELSEGEPVVDSPVQPKQYPVKIAGGPIDVSEFRVSEGPITKEQKNRLLTLAASAGKTKLVDIREYMMELVGKDTAATLTQAEYRQICTELIKLAPEK